MFNFIRTVAESIAEAGLKGLAHMVPGGAFALAVAEGVLKKIRGSNAKPPEVAAGVAATAAADTAKTAAEVDGAVKAAAPPGATADEVIELRLYLTQVPDRVRQSLKRAEDPSGRTVPAAFAVTTAEDVLKLLPPRPPRFRPGAAVPGRGEWVLERLLGTGGFGEVWRARHTQTPSLARAVKFCLGQSGQDLIHEAALIDRVMAAGSHSNIVPLVDAYLTGDTPWLMFEYVGGSGASDWIHLFAKLPHDKRLKQAVNATRQLASAVAFFHALSPPIVHRDLKPANILFDQATNQLRVTDFGIGSVTAKEALDGAGTTSGRLLTSLHGSHTPLYASPQQKAGGTPDPRDDVHALGVIAYQIMTGHLDQGAGPDFADDLREAGAGEELVALLGKCVAQKADRRLASAVELKEQLTALAGKTATPPPPAPTPAAAPPVSPPIAPEPSSPVPAAAGTDDPPDIAEEYPSFLSAWGTDASVKTWLERRMDRIARWEQAARIGSPRAAVLTAACHQYGVGMGRDDAEALRLYRVAADGGNAEGMHMVGFFHDTAIGVPEDFCEAMKWYRAGAAAGNTYSMVFAGDLFSEGQGVAVDLSQAMKWYRTAAGAGSALGMRRLGQMFLEGTGVALSHEEARKWIQKAVDAGDPGAMADLGDLYFHGHGVSQDYLQAMVWYKKAASHGFTGALHDIGYLFENGYGIPANLDEAVSWYERGAEAGDATAMASLGDVYFEGKGRRKKYKDAMEWYRKAAAAGSAYACHQLGWMHQNSLGVDKKDYPEALRWYRLGAERGQATSMFQLGWFHEEGMGTSEDLALALEWYEMAEAAGVKEAAREVKRVRRLLRERPAAPSGAILPPVPDDPLSE